MSWGTYGAAHIYSHGWRIQACERTPTITDKFVAVLNELADAENTNEQNLWLAGPTCHSWWSLRLPDGNERWLTGSRRPEHDSTSKRLGASSCLTCMALCRSQMLDQCLHARESNDPFASELDIQGDDHILDVMLTHAPAKMNKENLIRMYCKLGKPYAQENKELDRRRKLNK